jgi:hypothetical protein
MGTLSTLTAVIGLGAVASSFATTGRSESALACRAWWSFHLRLSMFARLRGTTVRVTIPQVTIRRGTIPRSTIAHRSSMTQMKTITSVIATGIIDTKTMMTTSEGHP